MDTRFCKRFFLIVTFLSAAPALAQAQADTSCSSCGAIKIGIIGDQTAASNLTAAYGVLQQGVNALRAQGLKLVLHTGDLLESSADPDAVRTQYAQATGILNGLAVPWFMTPGDHDVDPPTYQPDSADRSREALFQELYGAKVPEVKTHPYYSFDAEGYHFVALYSHETLHVDPRWGDIFLAQVSDAQLNWLAADLDAHRTAKAVVVFVHQPLWYNWGAWQRVHEVLRRYPVVAVIAGHFHYNQDEGMLDGIRYVTVGATGANVKHGSRNAGNVQHVTVATVSRKGVEFKLIPVSDTVPLSFTPRIDMDRLQTLDIVLGNLWDFSYNNPVYVQDGALVSSCATAEPAKIAIVPIGNSIDVPVDFSVAFDPGSSGVALAGEGFLPGQCQTVLSSTECLLARGARVWSSNNSSVQVDSYAGSLWESALAIGGNPPAAGTVLSFDVRMGFAGRSGDLYLDSAVATTVSACQ